MGFTRYKHDIPRAINVLTLGNKVILYCIVLYCIVYSHHQNDSCIQMGSNKSHFNVLSIVRDKVTRQCPQTTTFEEKEEPKGIRTVGPLLASLSNPLPLGRQTRRLTHTHSPCPPNQLLVPPFLVAGSPKAGIVQWLERRTRD